MHTSCTVKQCQVAHRQLPTKPAQRVATADSGAHHCPMAELSPDGLQPPSRVHPEVIGHIRHISITYHIISCMIIPHGARIPSRVVLDESTLLDAMSSRSCRILITSLMILRRISAPCWKASWGLGEACLLVLSCTRRVCPRKLIASFRAV